MISVLSFSLILTTVFRLYVEFLCCQDEISILLFWINCFCLNTLNYEFQSFETFFSPLPLHYCQNTLYSFLSSLKNAINTAQKKQELKSYYLFFFPLSLDENLKISLVKLPCMNFKIMNWIALYISKPWSLRNAHKIFSLKYELSTSIFCHCSWWLWWACVIKVHRTDVCEGKSKLSM